MNNIHSIEDTRKISEFKDITFSGFKKTKVIEELVKCVVSDKVEAACNWCIELVCAGHFIDLWNAIISIVSRNIHIGNPKLPIYIMMRFNQFKEIVHTDDNEDELLLRNNLKIRQLFAEIIFTLCRSRKKHTLDSIKIDAGVEYNLAFISSKLKAPDMEYINNTFKPDDPKELFAALNEFAYNITSNIRNNLEACYWVEWMMVYEKTNKKKDPCIAHARLFSSVSEKYQKDYIWIIWDVVINECKNRNNALITKIINSLVEMFSIRYSFSSKHRNKFIIYFAISLLTEQYNMDVAINNDIDSLQTNIHNINIMYNKFKSAAAIVNTSSIQNNHAKHININTTNKSTNPKLKYEPFEVKMV